MPGTNVSDRRQFDRIGKSVPIWFGDEAVEEIKARTVNICDGGVLCRVRDDEVPWHVGDFVRTRLNIPRETPNTYFLETIETDCRVIRFEIPRDGDGHLVALAFHPRVDLGMK
ncbi:MAG TPA: PilZ domain-containing protein [Phycisphaerae bacterium]|nr:PilZ domain-containing protein [Phycisphaerae bacterium]HOI54711.1 PilZ domain-containing protein [Phycisphaerae bacterium]